MPHLAAAALRALICVLFTAISLPALATEPAPAPLTELRLNVEESAGLRLAPEPTRFLPSLARVESPAARRLANKPFAKLIEIAANEAALDPALVHAVISVESGYNATARSPKGALGLMQVLPETALRYGIRNAAKSPAANLRAGTLYLKDLMLMFDRRLDLVLAAYNAGEGAVMRYGERIPPFRETRQYVPAVLARYREWRDPPPTLLVDGLPASSDRVRIEYMPGTVLERNFTHLTRFQ
ncbi:MAG: Lytic transglycosylase catalytic [Betaproteobacteria bacterium]|nr:Lytic transglycosylase catalytic [Betaproteobacteria bacterium]